MLNNKRTVFFSIFIATIAIWLFIFSVDSVRASLYEMANPNRVPLSGLTPPAEPASSEKGSVTDINPDNYRPVINITIGGFTKESFATIGKGGICYTGNVTGNCIQVAWLSQYIQAIYRYGISVAVILTVVMVMVGGFIWLMSAGSPDKVGKAKEFIISAFAGLLLALFSYLILFSINPRLVALEALNIQEVAYQAATPMRDGSVGTNPANYYTGPGNTNTASLTPEQRGQLTPGQQRTLLEENFSGKPYLDPPDQKNCPGQYSASAPAGCTYSVGYGCQIQSDMLNKPEFQYFRDDFADGEISKDTATRLFQNRWQRAETQAKADAGTNWTTMTQDQQDTLVDIEYNLGSLTNMPKARDALAAGDYQSFSENLIWSDPANHTQTNPFAREAASETTSYFHATGNRAYRNYLVFSNGSQTALLNP